MRQEKNVESSDYVQYKGFTDRSREESSFLIWKAACGKILLTVTEMNSRVNQFCHSLFRALLDLRLELILSKRMFRPGNVNINNGQNQILDLFLILGVCSCPVRLLFAAKVKVECLIDGYTFNIILS